MGEEGNSPPLSALFSDFALCLREWRENVPLCQFFSLLAKDRIYFQKPDLPQEQWKAPIVLVSAFLVPRQTVFVLAQHLFERGHPVYIPDIMVNLGREKDMQAIRKVAIEALEDCGKKPVVIGQSIGGTAFLSLIWENKISGGILLGSPIGILEMERDKEYGANRVLLKIHQKIRDITGSGESIEALKKCVRRKKPNVPMMAIYSMQDGVVSFDQTKLPAHWDGVHNLSAEVVGSHTGMSVNPHVFKMIDARLDWHSRTLGVEV